MGVGMPSFGGAQSGLMYGMGAGKKGAGVKREGFNAMSEDMFPSLPGSSAVRKPGSGSPNMSEASQMGQSGADGATTAQARVAPQGQRSSGAGRDTEDRYRLIGLLPIVRNPPPDLKMMALGVDLTTLGLNLNSPGANDMFAHAAFDSFLLRSSLSCDFCVYRYPH